MSSIKSHDQEQMNFLEKVQKEARQLNVKDWKILTDTKELVEIVKESYNKPVVLFKHSTRCGLSSGAKFRLEESWDELTYDIHFYYLDLIAYRDVSNLIANQFDVVHQSPQIIIVYHGKAIYHTSHHRISISDLNIALGKM